MKTPSDHSYPEHEKMQAVLQESQAIGQFIDSTPYVLAEYREIEGYREAQLVPMTRSIERILAEHFGIDLGVIETEKRAMLDSLREPG